MAPLKLLLAASLVVASFTQGQSPEPRSSSIGSRGTTAPSAFHAVVRGDVTDTTWGEAEFGAVAAFLVSEHASYITGQSIAVDGARAGHLL